MAEKGRMMEIRSAFKGIGEVHNHRTPDTGSFLSSFTVGTFKPRVHI